MVNFGSLAAEIGSGVLGTPANLNRFHVLGALPGTARHSSSGRQPNFAALNRGRHLYSAGQPPRWALAHILVFLSCFFFMAALWNKGQATIFLPCGVFLSSSIFFPRLISAVAEWISTILRHVMCS